MKKLYIAGPMAGKPELNFPAFHAAEAELKALGYAVFNPAKNTGPDTWQGYMRSSIAQVINADGIAYLPGSWEGRGSRIEIDLGHSLDMDVRPINEWIGEES